MRISAVDLDALRYRVYDYPAGGLRKDLCWVDDVLNQVGVGYADIVAGEEHVLRVEQRKRVLIIPGLYWVSLDLPEEETKQSHTENFKVSVEETHGTSFTEFVVVR